MSGPRFSPSPNPAKPPVAAGDKDSKNLSMVDVKSHNSYELPLQEEFYLEAFYDTIYNERFTKPVIPDTVSSENAVTWEEKHLKEWMKTHPTEDPHRSQLRTKTLIPNRQVTMILEEYDRKIIPRLERLKDLTEQNKQLQAELARLKPLEELSLALIRENELLQVQIKSLDSRQQLLERDLKQVEENRYYKDKYSDLQTKMNQYFADKSAAQKSKTALKVALQQHSPSPAIVFHPAPCLASAPQPGPAVSAPSHSDAKISEAPKLSKVSFVASGEARDYKQHLLDNNLSEQEKLNEAFLAMIQDSLNAKDPLKKMEEFFLNGANPNAKPLSKKLEGKTALILLIEQRRLNPGKIDPLIARLMKEKIEIDATDINGNSALHWAAMANDIDAVKLLMNNKARQFTNLSGNMPYIAGVLKNPNLHYEIYEALNAYRVTPPRMNGVYK